MTTITSRATFFNNAVRNDSLSNRLADSIDKVRDGMAKGDVSEHETSALLAAATQITEQLGVGLKDGLLSAEEEHALHGKLDGFERQVAGAASSKGDAGGPSSNSFLVAQTYNDLGAFANSLRAGDFDIDELKRSLGAHRDTATSTAESKGEGGAKRWFQDGRTGNDQMARSFEQFKDATNHKVAPEFHLGGNVSQPLETAVRSNEVLKRTTEQLANLGANQAWTENVSMEDVGKVMDKVATAMGSTQQAIDSGGGMNWKEEQGALRQVDSVRKEVARSIATPGDGSTSNPVIAERTNWLIGEMVAGGYSGSLTAGELANTAGNLSQVARQATQAEQMIGMPQWMANYGVLNNLETVRQQTWADASNTNVSHLAWLRSIGA